MEVLYRKITENLTERIRTGDLAPGESVPSVSEICRTHSVSRITALRVLRELGEARLITKSSGRGYFVAAPAEPVRCDRICCLFRQISSLPYDHYFNDVMAGIQQQASVNRIDLLIPGAVSIERVRGTGLDHALLMTAVPLASEVAGYLVDERVNDDTCAELMRRSGRKIVVVNRASALPVHSVTCSFRQGFAQLFDAAKRLGYEYFVIGGLGEQHPGYPDYTNAFFEEAIRAGVSERKVIEIPEVHERPLAATLDGLAAGLQRAGNGRMLLMIHSGSFAIELLKCFVARNWEVPRDFGMACVNASEGYPVRVTSLNPDPFGIGRLALNLLRSEIRGADREFPRVHAQDLNLIFGTTM